MVLCPGIVLSMSYPVVTIALDGFGARCERESAAADDIYVFGVSLIVISRPHII